MERQSTIVGMFTQDRGHLGQRYIHRDRLMTDGYSARKTLIDPMYQAGHGWAYHVLKAVSNVEGTLTIPFVFILNGLKDSISWPRHLAMPCYACYALLHCLETMPPGVPSQGASMQRMQSFLGLWLRQLCIAQSLWFHHGLRRHNDQILDQKIGYLRSYDIFGITSDLGATRSTVIRTLLKEDKSDLQQCKRNQYCTCLSN